MTGKSPARCSAQSRRTATWPDWMSRHSDASHAEKVLGWKTRPEKESIRDCARSLFEHGVVKL